MGLVFISRIYALLSVFYIVKLHSVGAFHCICDIGLPFSSVNDRVINNNFHKSNLILYFGSKSIYMY